MPINYRIPPARIYVVNHSRTRKWKRLVQSVSHRSGAYDRLMDQDDKKFREVYGNEDMIYRAVRDGRDMNKYKDEIYPCVFALDVPGAEYETVERTAPNGHKYYQKRYKGKKKILIPPAHKDTPDRLIYVEVPEGTWDYYLGNYDRMQGYAGKAPREDESFDAVVQNDEQAALAIRWQKRYRDPVFASTDNARMVGGVIEGGETALRNNPHGILQFYRVPANMQVDTTIDKDYLAAMDLFEVQ